MSEQQKIIDSLLKALQRNHIRCTYSAAGELIGTSAQSISQYLGERRPEASWVVGRETGKPTGYSETDCHTGLFENSYIIQTGAELQVLIQDD